MPKLTPEQITIAIDFSVTFGVIYCDVLIAVDDIHLALYSVEWLAPSCRTLPFHRYEAFRPLSNFAVLPVLRTTLRNLSV